MGDPDPEIPGLAGEVGYVSEKALPCTERTAGLSKRIFPKRKRPSGALWGIPLQQQLQSPLHPVQGVCTSTGECLHLTSEGTETTDTNRGSAPPTRDCTHPPGSVCTSSWRELRPQAPGRLQFKEGSVHTPIPWRRPTIKKSG